MKVTHVRLLSALIVVAMSAASQQRAREVSKAAASRTKVVLLGTGTPVPDPDRSGPATAIVVDYAAYIVDFGPGIVRRAKAAVLDRHISALEPASLKVAFCHASSLGSHCWLPRFDPDRMDGGSAHATRSVRPERTPINDRTYSASLSD